MIRRSIAIACIVFASLTLFSSAYKFYQFLSFRRQLPDLLAEIIEIMVPALALLAYVILQIAVRSNWFKSIVALLTLVLIAPVGQVAYDAGFYGIPTGSKVYLVFVLPAVFALLTMLFSLVLPAGVRMNQSRPVPTPPSFE